MKNSRVKPRFARRAIARPMNVAPVLRRALCLHAFAARLRARHARAAARWSGAELLLAKSSSWFVTQLTQQYLVSLSVIERRMSTRRVFGQAVPQILRTHSSSAAPAADELALPRAGASGALSRELTLRRLVIERTRRDCVAPLRLPSATPEPGRPATHSAMFALAPVGRAAPPVAALPLVRHAPVAPKALPDNAAARAPRVNAAAPSRAAATVIGEREIERLAERVIGSIDRRIVAQRERFGRP
ncbi:MAG TPA: hypothetical protein VGO61_08565 [Steroidobacteraceae bacterium]|jgi:hypothetical protein|nr:hypothetical protein [Steroidobacteraceae bacterium]